MFNEGIGALNSRLGDIKEIENGLKDNPGIIYEVLFGKYHHVR